MGCEKVYLREEGVDNREFISGNWREVYRAAYQICYSLHTCRVPHH